MRLNLVFILFASCLVGCQSPATQPVKQHAKQPPSVADKKTIATDEATIAKRLDQKISVAFDWTPVKEVYEQLARKTGVNFYVSWGMLEAAGVEPDLPITLTFNDVPCRLVLDFVIKQAGAGAELEPIGWWVVVDSVQITTQRDISRLTYQVSYDIDPIIALIQLGFAEMDANTPQVNARQAEEVPVQHSRDEAVEIIVNLIQDTCGRQDQWAAYGGTVSSLRQLNGQLHIKSTKATHAQIKAILTVLHESSVESMKHRLLDQQVKPMIERADALRLNQQHAEALKVVSEAARIAPHSRRARALKGVIEQTMKNRKQRG